MQYIIEITNNSGEDVRYFMDDYQYAPTLTKDINEAQVFERENSAEQTAWNLSERNPELKARAVPINISIADHAEI